MCGSAGMGENRGISFFFVCVRVTATGKGGFVYVIKRMHDVCFCCILLYRACHMCCVCVSELSNSL